MLYPAFLIGLLGSLHCIGMCGPIALTVGVQSGKAPLRKAGNLLLYNLGRVVTYAFLGLVLGALGFGFKVAGLQQTLSIAIGVGLIIYAFWPSLIHRLEQKTSHPLYKANQWLKKSLGSLLKSNKGHKTFFIGLLNGLLPCGLVYFAVAAAVAVGSPTDGMWFMMVFGAGTIPLLMAFAFFGGLAGVRFKKYLTKALPVLVFCMGVLFIMRGLDLNIPYLSPELSSFASGDDAAVCH
jgi:sulfite exporter TauE/SafE